MLFEQRFWEPIARGEVTVTFRRWKRRQVAAGRRYRTAGGIIEVDAVDVVDASDITEADARGRLLPVGGGAGGRPAGHPGPRPLPDPLPHRRRPDPRAVLAAADALTDEDVDELDGGWPGSTRPAATGPGRWRRSGSSSAARRCGPATSPTSSGGSASPFKTDVRKLKNLGLTISLEVGYRLSPRGEAYLRGRVP